MIEESLLEVMGDLEKDEQDSVRLLIVEGTIAMARTLAGTDSEDLVKSQIEPIVIC